MAQGFKFARRTGDTTTQSGSFAEILEGWRGPDERWLFVSPHDDDTVIGAGMTVLAAHAEGVECHLMVVTEGSMGYCEDEHKHTVSGIRRIETVESCKLIGIPEENIHFLGFPDCDLANWAGRRWAREGDIPVMEGFTGLQNSFVKVLRQVIPTRVFLPTSTDFHPDHQVVTREMNICLFHAQGSIWPELGAPLATVPEVYEYATYCDFPSPPTIKIEATAKQFETKLAGIAAYRSQKQIELIVDHHREGGPVEFLREVNFHFYSPKNYEGLF